MLGAANYGTIVGYNFVKFAYKQPQRLKSRGVDLVIEEVPLIITDKMIVCGHGTYWETAPRIVARGMLSPSDESCNLGEREWHGITGVYATPQFSGWSGHYPWPANVFESVANDHLAQASTECEPAEDASACG